MRYKTSIKLLIDKRKLDTLIRLNCPKEVLIDLIFENKLTLTGDNLIDDNLESLLEIKEFENWGGSRKGSGRPKENQLENQLENQDEIHLENQLENQVGDKDKDKDYDKDKDIDTHTNKEDSLFSISSEEKEKKEKEKIYGECCNVHLTDSHYAKLLNEILSKKALDELIDELSLNIARSKAPPYSEEQPDCHYACLKVYWRNKKQGQNKPQPQTQADKAAEFKKMVKDLGNKYRLQEANSG